MQQDFASCKAIKFGTNIGHAPGDHHAPDVGAGLTSFHDAQHPQRPACGSVAGRVVLDGWQTMVVWN